MPHSTGPEHTNHLADVIEKTESLSGGEMQKFEQDAKNRIREAFSWEGISGQYETVWTGSANKEGI